MSSGEADLARPLRLLSLAAFASMASMRWCDALLPVLAEEFDHSPGETAPVVYAFAIAYGVMQLLYGPLGDRLGKYTVVRFAALASTFGALASALAPSLGWLTLARVASGATAAAVIPLAMAWIGDHVPLDQRQAVLARLLGATVAGMIAGQWLAGVFADTVGWRSGFVALALLFAIAGVTMGLGMRRKVAAIAGRVSPTAVGATVESSLSRIRQVLASKTIRQMLVVTAVEGAFAFSALAFAPSHLHARFGLAVSSAGAVLVLYGVGGLLYSHGARWLLRRSNPLSMARAGGLLGGLAWMLFAFAPNWTWTVPLALAAGLGFYLLHSTLQLQATQMAPEQRGTAVSLFACALFLGQSAGMVLASWLVDRLSTDAVLAGCGVGLGAVGLFVGAMRLPATARAGST